MAERQEPPIDNPVEPHRLTIQQKQSSSQVQPEKMESDIGVPEPPLFPDVSNQMLDAPPTLEVQPPIEPEQHEAIQPAQEPVVNVHSPKLHSAKTMTIPISHIPEIDIVPAGINLHVNSQSSPASQEPTDQPKPTRRRVSFSGSSERHNWAVEVKHVIREEPEREREETHERVSGRSISSVSQCGDASQLNRQVEESNLGNFSHRRFDTIREPELSDDSEIDNEQQKSRKEQLHRLAEQNKQRLEVQLADSNKFKKQLEDETPFARRLFASVVVSTVVGGATALLTKNKRNSVLAGLAALAASFIIQ